MNTQWIIQLSHYGAADSSLIFVHMNYESDQMIIFVCESGFRETVVLIVFSHASYT